MATLTEVQRAALTARLRQGRAGAAHAIQPRDPDQDDLPLSFGQEQLWFIDRFAPGQAMYNIPLAISLRGRLDVIVLRRAVDDLVARHEALRTRLVRACEGFQGIVAQGQHSGQPVQVIDPPGKVPVALADLSGGRTERQDRLADFIDTEALGPFDLSAGPLLRLHLIRLGDDDHVLLVVVHHTVFDGWSAGVLVRDLAALYRHQATGDPAHVAELPIQFADYALWERGRLAGDVAAELAGYWREVMEGFETVHFPTDRPRPVVQDWAGGLAVRTADLCLLDDLRELSRQHGTTLFVTLMAGLQALLHRYTGQTDLVVGTVSANRRRPELADLIGYLVNTLPIRADLSADPPFTELLDQVKHVTTGAYAHQDLPFGMIVDTLKVDRDPGRAPVFQIALAYAERDSAPIEAAGIEFALTDLVAGVYSAKFDLSFVVEARPSGLWFECSYKTSLFCPETVQALLEHLEVLLRGAVADPDGRLSELPVLTRAELDRELLEWNDTATTYPQLCVHEAFERQARRTPDAIAAEYVDQTGVEQISYAELDRRAEQIARQLRERGVRPEQPVGVCLPANLTRLAAVLGIWKAGGGYVPLDPALPVARLSFMIADTAMAVIVTDDRGALSLPDATAAVIRLGEVPPVADDQPASSERPDRAAVRPANVAYVIYTSGSTGQPKGVVVEHRQAVNFLLGAIDAWHVRPDDSVLQFASLNFDASVVEMYMPLLAGATVVLAAPPILHSPPRLAALIRDRHITFACLTPAVLSLLADHELPGLRTLLAAGEELPSELARRWQRPGLRLINAYGPTETTVIATWQELTAQAPLPPAIGSPGPNYQAYVLDENLRPVPPGVTGELHLGGAGVARGYLNRPALTATRFIPDPWAPGGRLYKTGDLCRRRHDGSIVFAGRSDHQVKIRGLRIELGEIETALAENPQVAQAIVTVTTSSAGEAELTGYLRPVPGTTAPSPAELCARLALTLPSYMVPTQFVTVDYFPLNTSGKVDRRSLPAPTREPVVPRGHAASDAASGVAGDQTPAAGTEAALTELFATVLRRPELRPTDNFFDSGGNSLLVMRLVDLVTIHLGHDLGPATVFQHPSPRQLAARLDTTSADSDRAPTGLIPLTASTTEPPVVLIHAIAGTVTDYGPLATALAGHCAVYGLQAPGLTTPGLTTPGLTTPGLTTPGNIATTLAELVTRYARIIWTAFPHGPYRLGGWSMGAVIAYEVTRLLERDGAEVSLLALLDPPYAIPSERARTTEDLLAGQFVADVTLSLGLDRLGLRLARPDPASTPAPAQIAWLAGHLDSRAGTSPAARAMTAQLAARFEVFRAHWVLLAGYQPEPPGSVRAPTLIVSANDSPNAPTKDQWPAVLTGPVTTLAVDGDHYTFLRPPSLAKVAASIAEVAGRR